MKLLKLFLIFLLSLATLTIVLLVTQKCFTENNINYQLKMLQSGTTKQKIDAIEFIAAKNAYKEIPNIMPYIDFNESFLYYGKDPYTITCAVTLALKELTNEDYGNTCDSSHSKTYEETAQIKENWKDWYKNEYPTWLKEHSSNQ